MSGVLLVVLLVFTIVCKGYDEACTVHPKDPVIKMGSDIQIFFTAPLRSPCRNISSFNPDQLFWKLNDERIPEDQYSAINSTVFAVHIRNFTRRSGFVMCYMNVDGRDTVFGGTHIKAGLPPQKPTNISCVLFFSTAFTCYWDVGRNTFLYTTYTLIREVLNENETCQSKTNECTFGDGNVYHFDVHTVVIKAENVLGKVYSEKQHLDPMTVVKTSPPEGVVITPMLKKVIRVKWKTAHELRGHSYLTLICQVKSQESDSNTTVIHTVTNGWTEMLDIQDVKLCTSYIVSVQCSLNGSIYWSDWSKESTALSLMDVEFVQLHLWRKIKAPTSEGDRAVLLMWKGLQPSDGCDLVQGYKLTIEEMNGQVETITFSLSNMRTLRNVSKKAHELRIVAYSSNSTTSEAAVTIPALGEALPPVVGVQAYPHSGQIFVSWNSSDIPVNKYVIDWSVDWSNYDWEETKATNISIKDKLERFRLYSIAVTPIYDEGPGQEAIIHTYLEEGEPGKIPLVKALDIKATEAAIKWTEVPENERRGFIRNYTVFYRKEEGPELSITVSSDILEHHLSHLEPNTKYTLHVMASTNAGGSNSSTVVFRTLKYDSSFIKAISVIGGLGILLMVAMGISCFILVRKILFPEVPSPRISSIGVWPLECSPKDHLSNEPENVENKFHVIERITCNGNSEPTGKMIVHPPDIDLSSDEDEAVISEDSVSKRSESGSPENREEVRSIDSTPGSEAAEDTPLINPYLKNASKTREFLGNSQNSKEQTPCKPEQNNNGQAYVTVDMFSENVDNKRIY
uniref:Interleukin-6 receptor subunit beta-like n=1 Tax=Lepisosteus oculatus TaxID=7918 RepID=W5MYB6_LEPOC|nr:PREDICTED: interleukin-6 receptor subunit beta-like [Lepisosteus oculatus]